MPTPVFRRVGVTVKSGLPEKDAATHEILEILKKEGVEIFFDETRREGIHGLEKYPPLRRGDSIDLLLVIGGDGTILRAIREFQCFDTPILSINRGTIGFLAETRLEEAPSLLPKFIRGEGEREHRRLLHVQVLRGEKCTFRGYVLNEAVIAQGAIARLLDLQTFVNGEALATFHADGLIIATPTGSTAYSLAAGGPIVHPKLPATILTPVNPHSLSQKPIVIPGNHRIEVDILKKENKFFDTEVSLTLDGQEYITLDRHDRVLAESNGTTVTFLRRKQDTFFGTLREKLRWAEPLER